MIHTLRIRYLLALGAFGLAGACGSVTLPQLEPAWSAEHADHPLTHRECIDLAAHSTPTAAAWQAKLLAARAALRQAGALPDPTLQFSFEDLQVPFGAAVSTGQYTISLAVSLADVLTRGGREDAARADLVATEAGLRAEYQALAADVSNAYDELVAARRRAAVRADLEQIARDGRDAAAGFVRSGTASGYTLEQAEAELLDATARRLDAEADARARELAFCYALGFARPVVLQLAEAMTDTVAAGPDAADVLQQAIAARPEVVAARAHYDAELARADLARNPLRFLPTVSAGPRFTKNAETSGVAGLDVPIPVFDGGGAAIDTADASVLAAAADLERVQRRVAAEVDAALLRHDNARAALDRAGELRNRRRDLRVHAERLFPLGNVRYAEVLQARRDAAAAELDLLDAEVAVAAARVAVAASTGTLVTAPGY